MKEYVWDKLKKHFKVFLECKSGIPKWKTYNESDGSSKSKNDILMKEITKIIELFFWFSFFCHFH